MEAYKLREKILREINDADEILLKVVEDAIESYHQIHLPIVSEPISIEQYNREYEIAEQQIASGDVFTQEEVTEIIKRDGKKVIWTRTALDQLFDIHEYIYNITKSIKIANKVILQIQDSSL